MAKLFLDSGAFSAWANNTEIYLQDYIDFIKLHKDELEVYCCLDVIDEPDKTWANQKEMERQGLTPLPVYHVKENMSYLKRIMAEYTYFALGGMALASSRTVYFDRIFKEICPESNDFFPTHKVHGFGVASPNLLIKYPWYSADTTSWVQYGRYGIILVPATRYYKIDYKIPPHTYAISSRSKAVGDAKHFSQIGESTQKEIIKYCTEKGFKIGKTEFKDVSPEYKLQENEKWFDRKVKNRVEVIIEPGLCCDGEMRDKLNLEYFLDLEKKQQEWPWQFKQQHHLFVEDF